MKTIREVLEGTTRYLASKGIAHARREAELLLGEALGLKRIALYMDFERPLTEAELKKVRSWLRRRGNREPLGYIRGEADFYDCILTITPDVIVPRQETELLVDKIVQELKDQDLTDKVLWDVCCGPGGVGIALKKKFPILQVVLSDIAPGALTLALANAARNGVDVEGLLGDLLEPFAGRRTHFFVCNPPYISEADAQSLEPEVQHEPRGALVGGESGLEFYQRLAVLLPLYLHPNGKVWFEIGYDQGEAVRTLFSSQPWKNARYERDLSGHSRFFSVELE